MHVGKAVILSASFIGSQQYMSQYFKDSLAICRAIGHPSSFITMTCNSKWPEIQEMLKLLPNVDPVDAPDIVSHVFKLKLDQLLDLIKKKNYFGNYAHVHMLIWLSSESRPNFIEKVDQLVFTKIPDKNSDPIAYEAVKNYMMHGPSGKDLYTSPCMVKENACVISQRDLMAIPILTIVVFLFIGGCHINLKICNSLRLLKYLFKYCLKGHDTATMLLKNKSNKSGNEQTARFVKNLDEVKNFLDGRYVCASEASWRIFGFDIHHRSPSVEHLPIHFPGQKWKLRQRGDVIGRLAEVHATTGELLYLRMLLLRCKGALSFTQLRTIDGTTYDTFKEACGALGLLNNDKQWHDALEEDAFSAMPSQIRAMFVNILANSGYLDVYNAVLDNVNKNKGGMFFVYGSGGCGKTFLWKTLCSRFRSEGKIVLPIAGSGIAVTLRSGGRTAHSRFKIPLKLDQSSIPRIKHGTYINEEKRPFGGITVVFCGDFEQILPVLPKAGRAEIVNASFNKSQLWKSCKVFLLSQNMRLHSGNSEARHKVMSDFSKWQLEIGDGRVECIDTHRTDVETEFVVPDEYVVKIDDINAQILERVPGNVHTYLSQDSIEDRGVDDNVFDSSFPIEYLNFINMPCMPKYELKVKVGAIVMLMRNLNQIMGLCNDTYWPFEFKRTQFPLQICFVMTVNKSQGQSLDTFGLYLPRPVFSHGQLYVAISLVTSPEGLHILIDDDNGKSTNITSNVMFEEVFNNLHKL
ncbi:uncharacterized protein LOC141714921 [Apium graveolens]|uniref:uncharacterized protein LOC141714921 n=1 Tax=Apium graveolens TaxID=4045 RepID=UPI003D7B424B